VICEEKMLTVANENRYHIPALENTSAGFDDLMELGGHTASRRQSRRFFCVRCMAAPTMGGSCGEPYGSPVPIARSSNLYGLLALLEQGGRETEPFNRRNAMSTASALSMLPATEQEETITLTKTQFKEFREAWAAISALELLMRDSVSGDNFGCGSILGLIERRLGAVFEELPI
jgi:hypothetical protein